MVGWLLTFGIGRRAWPPGRAAAVALVLARPWPCPSHTTVGTTSGGMATRKSPFRTRTFMLKAVGSLHRFVYQGSGGRLGGTLRGRPILLLTTTGRTTGRERTWPLCYLEAGDALVLVAASGGNPVHPAWYLNLRANPCVLIQVGDTIRPMVAKTARGAERARLWESVIRRFPVCVGYQRKTSRAIPLVTLRPAPTGYHRASAQSAQSRDHREQERPTA